MKMELRYGTWNVLSLFRKGALRNIMNVVGEYKLDILAIQEIRWTGKDVIEQRLGTIYYSCGESHHFGTGFVVGKYMKQHVLDFIPVDERICILRVKGRFNNYSLISVHAPTEEKEDSAKDTFYDLMEKAYDSCPSYDVKMIMGDLNAKVGREEWLKPAVGIDSLHNESNNNGMRLANFANNHHMIIGGTHFPHKGIHKGTWRSPNGLAINQIDHILIDYRHKSSLLDVRCMRGANADSDHFLVISKIRSKICRNGSNEGGNNNTRAIYDTEKLRNPEVRLLYTQQVATKIQELNNDHSGIQEGWDKIQQIVKHAADTVLGEKGQLKRKAWYDDECEKATIEKNEAYKKMIQKRFSQITTKLYKERRAHEKKVIRRKKRDFEEDQVKRLDNINPYKESRKFYQQVTDIRGHRTRVKLCRDENNRLLSDRSSIMKRWQEHFHNLLGINTTGQTQELTEMIQSDSENPVVAEHPDMNELKNALRRLNNYKSPGADGISTEMMKIFVEEPSLLNELHQIMCKIWDQEDLPRQWGEALICPIHKNGDRLKPENYRGISLLNTGYKIFSNILYERLKQFTEPLIGNYQCGFREKKSTTDHIHMMRQIIEKTKEYGLSTFHLFIDFKAAYDTINREKLSEAMEELGIPNKLIRLVNATLRKVQCRVKITRWLSDPFDSARGLRQGDALSCLLFNVALEKAIRDSGIIVTGTILKKSVQLLAYADDIVIVGRTITALREAASSLIEAARVIGLNVNERKTKYMEITKKKTNTRTFEIEEYTFERVNSFKYLGSLLTQDNSSTAEIKARISMANRSYFGLKQLFGSRFLRHKYKLKLYKTLLRPIVMYGTECLALNRTDINLLGVFERKILRRIFGPVQDSGNWRIRHNREVYELYNSNDIVKEIKLARLRWLGHICRLPESATCKEMTFTRPTGARRVGRPPLRWLDGIEEDLKRIGLKNWRRKARDRETWNGILKEAQVHL